MGDTSNELQLNKAAAQYKSKTEEYDNLLQRIVQWFSVHLDEVWKLIFTIHSTDAEVVTYDTFKAVLTDFKAPFTGVELHLLSLLLDPDADGCIQMKDLEAGVLRFWSLMLDIPMFDMTNKIIVTTEVALDDICEVGDLYPESSQHCRLNSPSFNLFSHKTALPKDVVPAGVTLEDLGILGGQRLAPEEFTVYYQPLAVFSPRPPPHTVASLTFSQLIWVDEFEQVSTSTRKEVQQQPQQQEQGRPVASAATTVAAAPEASRPVHAEELDVVDKDDEDEILAESLDEFLTVERVR
ncbi:unnamed protein product [Dibothriocephalus latus]|uniref:EF-hand domain-containing protein n=1 Tax=Dibothriocephalus latus TaxID=60516 RepID=A0A3P6TFX4_DIBLA|nr:unnamed protein product [Dibothriocephalus latus]